MTPSIKNGNKYDTSGTNDENNSVVHLFICALCAAAVRAATDATEEAEAAAVEAAKMKFRQEQEIEEERVEREVERQSEAAPRLPISPPEIPCSREHFSRFDRGSYYGTATPTLNITTYW